MLRGLSPPWSGTHEDRRPPHLLQLQAVQQRACLQVPDDDICGHASPQLGTEWGVWERWQGFFGPACGCWLGRM